jgi:AAA+ ATPase superfamily predicted ATPase
MKKAPFKYGKVVSSEAFTNREEELNLLIGNLKSGINTIIISPRRWGKSSLVKKALNELEKDKKNINVTIDLFSINSQEEFLNKFASEVIKASSTKVEEWVKISRDFFKTLIPKFQFGPDALTEFNLSFDHDSVKKDPSEILNLPEKIGKKKNLKFIIAIDEFQNLAKYEQFQAFEKKLRAEWQRHEQVSYCLYGSQNHMMTDIFNDPSKPFFKFGDVLFLPKIKREKWISFIRESFERTEKKISEEHAELITVLMNNHSWYVQQLSHYTWTRTEDEASTEEIQSALNELINGNSPLYEREIEYCSKTQINLLKAIVKKTEHLMSVKANKDFKLGTPNNVKKNITRLKDKGLIEKIKGMFEFLDPAFEIWFKREFYNIKTDTYFENES